MINEAEFKRLAEKHRPFLTNFAKKLLRNSVLKYDTDPEDLVQETLLRAWTRISLAEDGYEERGKSYSWLGTILKNLFLNLKKQEERRGIRCDQDKRWVTRTLSQESPEEEVLDKITRNQISSAIRRLISIGSEELILAVEGKSNREIANELKEPVGTVKSRLSRGRKALKRIPFFSLAIAA